MTLTGFDCNFYAILIISSIVDDNLILVFVKLLPKSF